MGKGNRARIQRAQDKLDNPQNYVVKKQTPKWVGSAIMIFIALILVCSLTLSALYSSGTLMRTSNAMKTDNYTVSGTMLSYFFHSQYTSFVSSYSSIMSYIGLDTATPLKSQTCNMLSDGGTWYDYFMNMTTSYVNELLICCEYAKANGIELGEEELAEIDEAIESINSYAFQNGYSLNGYIAAMYGSGVKVKDVRASMELVLLANKAAVSASDKFGAALTEDEIQKYYDENPANFIKADYLVKSYKAELETIDEDDYETTADYEAAVSAADEAYAAAKAEALAKAKEYETVTGHQAFLDKLTAEINAKYDGYYDLDETLTDEEKTAKEKNQIDTELKAAMVEGYAYQDPASDDSVALAKWLFADGRKAGDIYVLEEEDEDKGTYTAYAYCVSMPAYRDEYTTVNMAYAMFPASEGASATAAGALKDKLVSGGVNTAEAFKTAVADQTVSGSGTLDNVLKGGFGYEEVDNFIFAEGGKAGDCAVINCGTDYIAVILNLGEGDVAWHATAKTGALNEKVSAWYEELAETYTVKTNEKALNKISA